MMSSRVRNTTGCYSASFLKALECFEFTLARAARTLAFWSSESTGAIRMDLPSVVNSTWDSGAILSKSRMGRSMTTAQLFPCFTRFLIIAYSTLQSIPMVDQCKYMIACKLLEVKGLPSFSIDAPPRSLRFHGNGLSKHPKTLEKQPSKYSANDLNLVNYSNYTNTYNSPRMFQGAQPYYAKMGIDSSSSHHDNKLMEKINYMIHLLEEQQYEKTANITEEFILYIFLGVFVIFTVDSFTRAGKYIR